VAFWCGNRPSSNLCTSQKLRFSQIISTSKTIPRCDDHSRLHVCFKVGFLVGNKNSKATPSLSGRHWNWDNPRLGASNEALLRHNRRSQPQLVQVSWFPNPVTEDHPKSILQQTFSDYVYSICIIQNTYIYIYYIHMCKIKISCIMLKICSKDQTINIFWRISKCSTARILEAQSPRTCTIMVLIMVVSVSKLEN